MNVDFCQLLYSSHFLSHVASDLLQRQRAKVPNQKEQKKVRQMPEFYNDRALRQAHFDYAQRAAQCIAGSGIISR